jgi:predicted metal-binding protein
LLKWFIHEMSCIKRNVVCLRAVEGREGDFLRKRQIWAFVYITTAAAAARRCIPKGKQSAEDSETG